jgi:hypothetical protein
MAPTPLEFRRIAISLTVAFAWTTAVTQLAMADEANLRLIQLASASEREPGRRASKEKVVKAPEERSPGVSVSPPAQAPVWVPRIRHGAPASRIGGATRSQSESVTIRTLVPEVDEAALTLAAQPRLYWHLSAETPHMVNFTLLDPNAVDPLVDAKIPGPFAAGVQVLSVADYKIQLEPGKRYEWFVALVPDPASRSADAVARGVIIRVIDPELTSQVASSEPEALAGLLAQSGIWYEAFDVVSRRMQEKPEDPQLRLRRDEMLLQVGLALSDDR